VKNNGKATTISRHEYASLFGPTVGDKIRLGDTDLYIEVEQDLRVYGDEALYGGGKTLRDGMGYDNQLTSVAGALDLVITNVVVVDPLLGVIKANVGIKDGRIVGVGKAGNAGTMDGVTPGHAMELGHAIGNQHWPAVVKDNCVFVPLAVDKQVMLAVMQTHGLPGVEYAFGPGAEVSGSADRSARARPR